MTALPALSAEPKTPAEARASILQLESCMLAMPEHQIELVTIHHFSPGVYTRELRIPKGTILTGKIQKTEYLNVISGGEMSVMTENGLKRLGAPAVLRSYPGLKRAGIAHEDTTWITVHENPTNERDIDKLESMLFADTFDEVPEQMRTDEEVPVITLQGKPKDPIKAQYLASPRTIGDVMAALNVTASQMALESNNPDDQVDIETDGVCIKDSPIHGKGMFASKQFLRGDVIAPARVGSKRAPAGRYSNHSPTPNAKMLMLENGDVNIIAIKTIEPGEEITSDYYLNFIETRRN